jgi:hypothetical protein
MVAKLNLYLALCLMVVINESLELDMWSFVYRSQTHLQIQCDSLYRTYINNYKHGSKAELWGYMNIM